MIVHKLDSNSIVAQILAAKAEAEENGEYIGSISLTDAEFDELLRDQTVNNTTSKWYGSNEGGWTLTGIQTRLIEVEENGKMVPHNLPVSAYFNGTRINRSN